jgi:hypothetical protein
MFDAVTYQNATIHQQPTTANVKLYESSSNLGFTYD